ncbi:MAG: hypothetical protein ACRC7Q_03735, partial [Plesiomonas shigelloides]
APRQPSAILVYLTLSLPLKVLPVSVRRPLLILLAANGRLAAINLYTSAWLSGSNPWLHTTLAYSLAAIGAKAAIRPIKSKSQFVNPLAILRSAIKQTSLTANYY